MKLKYLFIPAVVVFVIVALPLRSPDGRESLKFDFAKAPTTSKHTYPQSNEKEVQHIVETFFKGFHAQDSTLIKEVVHKGVMMQSIGKNLTGEMILSTQDFSGFLASICSIPETLSLIHI